MIELGHLNAKKYVPKVNPFLVMLNYMVSMATHDAILKNGEHLQNTHISAATHPRTLNFVSN